MDPLNRFTTKSGKPITIGTGTGTKWQWTKKLSELENGLCQQVVDQVLLSMKCGFNHLDTADIYTTAPELGEAVIKSGAKREDVWIASKYAPVVIKGLRAPDTITIAFEKALADLKTDYIDLFLIHSPHFVDDFGYTIESIWEELIELKKTGKIRYIGVSNYSSDQIDRSIKVSPSEEFYPVVNQIEFHPNLQAQTDNILNYCKEHNILVQGYNPLASLFKFKDEKLADFIQQLAEKYGKTNAQILLKWSVQMGVMPITTSSNEERIKQSLTLDFELTSEEVSTICEIGDQNIQRCFF